MKTPNELKYSKTHEGVRFISDTEAEVGLTDYAHPCQVLADLMTIREYKKSLKGLKLAFIGSIKDDVLDTTELGFELIKFLIKNNLCDLKARFPNVDFSNDDIGIYDAIGKSRGYLLRGGEIDYDRLGKAMLVDFRSGRMGKITLDRV